MQVMSDPNMWFVAKLRPHELRRAQDHLHRQNFETFSPDIKTTTLRSGVRIETRKALFPGYIFVRFDLQDLRWPAINATRGVSRLISTNHRSPTPVPDTIMQALIDRCDKTGLLLPPTDLEIGDRIRVHSGPFADTITVIESLPDQQRIGILIDFMGRKVKASLPDGHVEKLA